MKDPTPIINNDWDKILKDEFQTESFKMLMKNVENERKTHTILPAAKDVFTAFQLSSFSNTKIVIVGQDPYHSKGQAHGLAFSVADGEKTPPSLRNIFKELQSDLQITITKRTNLEAWARQGVLLLNSTLTVRERQASSHHNLGWERFTNNVISKLSSKKNGLIFLLWGAFAQKKASLINHKNHHILETSHPSPFSAQKGFFGSRHFSKTNKLLLKNNKTPIDWSLCTDTLKLF